MLRRLTIAVLAILVLCSTVVAAEEELEAGFRNPPQACRPARGWFLSKALGDTVAKCPEDVRPAFERALAEGAIAITPEDIKRMTTWQALIDVSVITSAKPAATPPAQPYGPLAKALDGYAARIAYVFSKTEAEGGIFTQSKSARGINIYPPAPGLYLVRRRLGEGEVYFAVSQVRIDTVVTITFPRVAGPELWDPEDGSIRLAPTYYNQDKRTMLNLRLGPYQALFVVLRKPPTKQHVTFASSALQITAVEPDGSAVRGLARVNGRCSVMFANGKMKTEIVKGLPPPLPIESGWSMKTRKPAKRLGVGIIALRCKRPDAKDDKPERLAAPDLDDSDWQAFEIGKSQPPASVAGAQWRAHWLTFEGDRAQRLFRKVVELPGKVDFATVTLTGDNGYEIFVNEQRLGADGNWNNAETYDIAKILLKGKNLFAVRAVNQGGIAGLLLESRIRLASGKLVRVLTDGTWKTAEKAPDGWQKLDFDDKTWGKPNVGGKPPVSPWGNVAGLPADPEAGESVWYRFKLPAGARSVRVPAAARDPKLYIDGKKVTLREGMADLSSRVQARPLVAALRTAGFFTLDKPILCECSDTAVGIGSWLLVGYPSYSGLADYTVELKLPDAYRKERLLLDLGEVGCVAQLSVNGRDLGTRLWRPYTFDITDALRRGRNAIKIAVANTAANASGKDLPAERLAAGIIGPVRILARRQLTIKAD